MVLIKILDPSKKQNGIYNLNKIFLPLCHRQQFMSENYLTTKTICLLVYVQFGHTVLYSVL